MSGRSPGTARPLPKAAGPTPLLEEWVGGYDGVHPIADVGAAYGRTHPGGSLLGAVLNGVTEQFYFAATRHMLFEKMGCMDCLLMIFLWSQAYVTCLRRASHTFC